VLLSIQIRIPESEMANSKVWFSTPPKWAMWAGDRRKTLRGPGPRFSVEDGHLGTSIKADWHYINSSLEWMCVMTLWYREAQFSPLLVSTRLTRDV